MALVDPRFHFFSEETQELNNRLPQWHAGRRKRDSNWAQLTSIIDGMGLEDYKRQEGRAYRNLFLQTAHLDEPDLLATVQIPEGTSLDPRRESRNLVRNSSFETRARPDKIADYWDHSGTVAVDSTTLFGAKSPSLTPVALETSRIYQTVTQDTWGAGDSRTFSAWYQIPTWAGGTIPGTSHGLIVSVTYGNGTTATFRTPFVSDTANKWRRISLTVSPLQNVAQYEIRLETARSGIFDIDVAISIDAVQCETGENATTWEDSLLDEPNWFFPRFQSPLSFDTEAPVFITRSLREFFYEAVPTRVGLFRTTGVSSTSDRRGGAGLSTDYFQQRWATTWDINTVTNKVRKVGIQPLDNYGEFGISLFTGTSEGPQFEEDVAGMTYRTVAGFGRWLWVVHEMLGLNGETITALSIVDTRVPFPTPGHYESKHTIQLSLPTGTDYHRSEFRFEDPQHLNVSSATQEFVLRLYYDYAMIDATSLRAFFRERYDSIALTR